MHDLHGASQPVAPFGRAAAALVPATLAALAWTPWVPVPVVATVVLVAFVARRIGWLRERAAWTAVYAAATVFALGPLSAGAAAERAGAYMAALALGLLVDAALDGTARGTPWAWAAPLALFAAWPTSPGALGGIGLALMGAMTARESRGGGAGSRHRSTRALAGVGALALALGLLALPLGGAGGLRDPGARLLPSRALTAAEAPGAVDEGSGRVTSRPARRRGPDGSRGLEASVAAILAAGVVLALAFVITLRAAPQAGRRPASWSEILPLGALALLATIAALVLSQQAPPGPADPSALPAGAGAGGSRRAGIERQAVEDELPAAADPEGAGAWTLVLTLAAAGAASYVGWLAWRLRSPDPGEEAADPVVDASGGRNSAEATGRVRAAYREFLAAAGRAGLGRLGAETPAELAARIGAAVPAANRPAVELARLYEPVRYGGLSDEQGALAAERALAELEGMLAPVSA